jgi:hypothetical protein
MRFGPSTIDILALASQIAFMEDLLKAFCPQSIWTFLLFAVRESFLHLSTKSKGLVESIDAAVQFFAMLPATIHLLYFAARCQKHEKDLCTLHDCKRPVLTCALFPNTAVLAPRYFPSN